MISDGIEALYNDGVTAKTHAVRLSLSDDTLDVIAADGGVLASWPRAGIRATDRGRGHGPLRLAGGVRDLERLTVTDAQARALILAALPEATRRAPVDDRTGRTIAIWTVGAIASLAVIVVVILPAVVRLIAPVIPQSVQAEIGARVADQLIHMLALMEGRRADGLVCQDAAGTAALTHLTGRLTAHSRPEIVFRVRVVDVDMANAFALPGGHILVTRGLIDFVGGANELAGVIGHEIGHVELDHALHHMIKIGGISALFSLLVGDVAGGAVIIAIGQAVIAGSYRQAAESEADLHAVSLMQAAKLDTRPFADFFVRLEEKHAEILRKAKRGEEAGENEGEDAERGFLQWISTHPTAVERTRAVRAAASPGGEALGRREWGALRKICGEKNVASPEKGNGGAQ